MLAFWHGDRLNQESWMPVLTSGFGLGSNPPTLGHGPPAPGGPLS